MPEESKSRWCGSVKGSVVNTRNPEVVAQHMQLASWLKEIEIISFNGFRACVDILLCFLKIISQEHEGRAVRAGAVAEPKPSGRTAN